MNYSVMDALKNNNCITWEDKNRENLSCFNVRVGIWPENGRFIAVYIVDNPSIDSMAEVVLYFLETINDVNGLAFVASTGLDVYWHMKIDKNVGKIRKSWVNFCRKFLRCFRKITKQQWDLMAQETIRELLCVALRHQEYDIIIDYDQLRGKNVDISEIYHEFLIHYRAIILDILRKEE